MIETKVEYYSRRIPMTDLAKLIIFQHLHEYE